MWNTNELRRTGVMAGGNRLQSVCAATRATHDLYLSLRARLARLPFGHRSHAPMTRLTQSHHVEWLQHVEVLCRHPSASRQDVLAKAALLSRMIERDVGDDVVGGAAMQLAASLADDILVLAGDDEP